MKKWLKPGDRVYSKLANPRMYGTITHVRKDVGMPYYTIRWDNGVIGHAGLASSGITKASADER